MAFYDLGISRSDRDLRRGDRLSHDYLARQVQIHAVYAWFDLPVSRTVSWRVLTWRHRDCIVFVSTICLFQGSSHQFVGADRGDVNVSVFLLSALPAGQAQGRIVIPTTKSSS